MPTQKITKEEIIKIAVEVFRKQGYHKTSMKDLADACQLHKGSFYYYFKSKEDLMQEVLKALHHYYNQKVFSIAYDEKLSARSRFIKMFKEQEPIITRGSTGCLFGNLTLETISVTSDFKERLKVFFSDWISAFQAIYQEKHDEVESLQLAQQSVMEIEGAIMMMRLYDDKKLFYDASQRALERL